MDENLHKQINPTIHQPVRLQIMTFLHLAKHAKFSELKRELGITDGNLGSHLQKLEDEKLITIKKKFVAKKPTSQISITSKGESELLNYMEILKSLIV
ncbi:transcriptional regulator [Patescibacteria group bacterium]